MFKKLDYLSNKFYRSHRDAKCHMVSITYRFLRMRRLILTSRKSNPKIAQSNYSTGNTAAPFSVKRVFVQNERFPHTATTRFKLVCRSWSIHNAALFVAVSAVPNEPPPRVLGYRPMSEIFHLWIDFKKLRTCVFFSLPTGRGLFRSRFHLFPSLVNRSSSSTPNNVKMLVCCRS